MMENTQQIKGARDQEREKVVAELREVLIDCWGGNKLLLGKDWKKLQQSNGNTP